MVTLLSIQNSNYVYNPQLRLFCFLSGRYYPATVPMMVAYKNSVFSIQKIWVFSPFIPREGRTSWYSQYSTSDLLCCIWSVVNPQWIFTVLVLIMEMMYLILLVCWGPESLLKDVCLEHQYLLLCSCEWTLWPWPWPSSLTNRGLLIWVNPHLFTIILSLGPHVPTFHCWALFKLHVLFLL